MRLKKEKLIHLKRPLGLAFSLWEVGNICFRKVKIIYFLAIKKPPGTKRPDGFLHTASTWYDKPARSFDTFADGSGAMCGLSSVFDYFPGNTLH